jgi:hypothetical protein
MGSSNNSEATSDINPVENTFGCVIASASSLATQCHRAIGAPGAEHFST